MAGRFIVEIVIIVLGVTIALWADSWMADRMERSTERARLIALEDNVADTLASLLAARENAAGAAAALERLASADAGELAGEELDGLLRYGLLYGPDHFYPEMNVYEDLTNSGELSLLSDAGFRRLLAVMAGRLELVRVAQSDMVTVQQIDVDPYLIANFDLGRLLAPFTGLDVSTAESVSNSAVIGETQFRNLAVFKLDLVNQLDKEFEAAERALVAVQQSISAQLASR